MAKVIVRRGVPCPECEGLGEIRMERDLNDLWEEVSRHFDAEDTLLLIERLEVARDCQFTSTSPEILMLLDVLKEGAA